MSTLAVLKTNKPNAEFKPKCNVFMGSGVDTYHDFVMVGYDNETMKSTLLMNTDVITLGHAYLMIAKEFNEQYEALSDEDKKRVDSVFKR